MGDAGHAAGSDLTPYVPRLLLEWGDRFGDTRHRAIPGTLVFADVSGFTRLSEALARKGGKIGAEQMADVINRLFGELLMLAARRGGEMLKYGGDAMLLFFSGDGHEGRGVAACADMQRRLREIGRVDTGAGVVRLRMSVGVHSGSFDFFVGGSLHRELIVAGPATTTTVDMEATADATEVLLSADTAAALPPSCRGSAKGAGWLLRRPPPADTVELRPVEATEAARHFLAATLVDHLSSAELQPEHRLATVSFLQFLELDRLLEAGRRDEAADRVHDVLSLVQTVYDQFGVTFLATDLSGDGGKVMAVAGAPVSRGDDEERMLRASRAIVDAGPALPVRIGVNRGHVFAGDVGPRFRRTYTVLGDVTNTAARVMGRARTGAVFALEEVIRPVKARVDAAAQEAFLAKGKREPLVPLEIVSVVEPAASSHETSELFGRDREVGKLEEMIRDALAGSGRGIELVGDPGAGKSTLARAVVAGFEGVTTVEVVAHPFARSIPFDLLGAMVRRLTGASDAEDAADAIRRRLSGADVSEDAVRLLEAALAPSVELPTDVAAMSPEQATALRDQAVAAVVRASGQSIVLVEDAHVMDDASADALRSLAAASAGEAVAILVTRRPGPPFFGEAAADLLSIDALDPESARAAARALAPTLPPDRRNRLVERADGNPLFLRSLLAAATLGAVDDTELPDTVEEVLAARLDAMPLRDRQLVRSLSVLGPSFEPSLAQAVVDDDVATALPALQEFLLGGDVVTFRHALHQEVAYASLPFRRRRELHASVASHLEARDTPAAELLAHHWYHAGHFERAWHHSRAAAEAASGNFALRDAATHLRRGLDAAAKAGMARGDGVDEAWRELARLLRWTGETDAARQAARRGRRLTERPGLYAALCQLEGEILAAEGRPAAALRWFRRGLAALRAAPSPAGDADVEAGRAEVRLLLSIGAVHRELGRPARSIVWCDEALDLAGRIGDDIGRGHSFVGLHLAGIALRRPDRREHGEAALAIFRDASLPKLEAQVLNNLGMDAHASGEWDDAIRFYAAAREAQRDGSDAVTDAVLALNIGEVLVDQRRPDDAVPLLEQSLTDLEAAGVWIAHLARIHLGRAHALRGAREEAEHLLVTAGEAFERMGAAAYAATARLRRAEALLSLDDQKTAAELVADVTAPPDLEPTRLRLAAQLADLEGDAARRDVLLQESLERATAIGSLVDQAIALVGLGDARGDELLNRLGVVGRQGLSRRQPAPVS